MVVNLVKSGVRGAYNSTIRPYLPKKVSTYNGVPVRDRRLFDITDEEEYKPRAIDRIRSEVNKGDTVVDIASGYGIFSVVAAKNGALVKSYDANPHKVELARETAKLSFVEDRIEVSQAIVGEIVDDRFENQSRVQKLDSVPECDILILDVEGAEMNILQQLSHRPKKVLVEVHPEVGVTVNDLYEIAENKGYDIDSVIDMKTHTNTFVVLYLDTHTD